MDLLETITRLSHEFGTSQYVKGGGGNTSAKSPDTLWVKPSGTTLAGLAADTFVALDRAKLGELYQAELPAEVTARESLVKDLMLAARLPGEASRPSVEAPLHDILPGRFVVHTHPELVNGLTCARDGAVACARLFPDALWVPYIDPGFTLCRDVRDRVRAHEQQHGCLPQLLILENHGVFVTADTADEIRAIYRRVTDTLLAAYESAGIATELKVQPAADGALVAKTLDRLKQLLGEHAAGVACGPLFAVARGPISPDHIVYAKSYPYEGALTAEGVDQFRDRHGYLPVVFVTAAGVFAVGSSETRAALALALARDGGLVQQLAGAFGGIQFLTDEARRFIENWEVEAYRQQQVG